MRWQTTFVLISGLVALGLAGCSDDDEDLTPEKGVTLCSDNKDNDGDGLVDCMDPDCKALAGCQITDSGTDGPLVDAGVKVEAGTDLAVKKDGPKPDHALADAASTDRARPDGLSTDAMPPRKEQEPNDHNTPTQVDAVPFPVLVSGAIGVPDDKDIFQFSASAGDRIVARITSGGLVQAHLAIWNPLDTKSTVINTGPGNDAYAEYYMFKTGKLLLAVQDRRNVGSSTQNVGGKTYTYTLSVLRLSRAPTPVTINVEKSSTLAPAGLIRVFSFTASKGDQLTIKTLAKQLTPPSDVDTRLSLFGVASKTWYETNDDATTGSKDSLIKRTMPASGTYHAIVENVNASAKTRAFKIKVSK